MKNEVSARQRHHAGARKSRATQIRARLACRQAQHVAMHTAPFPSACPHLPPAAVSHVSTSLEWLRAVSQIRRVINRRTWEAGGERASKAHRARHMTSDAVHASPALVCYAVRAGASARSARFLEVFVRAERGEGQTSLGFLSCFGRHLYSEAPRTYSGSGSAGESFFFFMPELESCSFRSGQPHPSHLPRPLTTSLRGLM